MRVCRFIHPENRQDRYAVVEAEALYPFESPFFPKIKDPDDVLGLFLNDVTLIAPVEPSKIVCVGRNYREHAAELGNKMPDEPLLFLKAPSAIIATDDQIELPPQSQQVEHEGELGVVIGKKARSIAEDEDPLQYVFGYTCVNDVTARDLQRKDVQFTRGKSFDTFCPVGPWIENSLDCNDLTVITNVNGEVKQRGHTGDMAFSVAYLIRYISSIMTLYPGDLIATGTPAGVSRLKHADTVEVEISGIGTLRNTVYDPSA
jgi:2-keto-4-pentenoate hydratase/2-oxohepta-3-ene-1,7-dioic acid hydratase in catechol pathway